MVAWVITCRSHGCGQIPAASACAALPADSKPMEWNGFTQAERTRGEEHRNPIDGQKAVGAGDQKTGRGCCVAERRNRGSGRSPAR